MDVMMSERHLSRQNPTFSPLEPIFAPYEGAVPYALVEQFYVSPDDPFDVVLVGKMHQVWHRPSWLWPFMQVAGWLGILVPKTGHNIPMTLRVTPGRDGEGKPYYTFTRTFRFPGRTIRFVTTVVCDPVQGCVAELVGPRGSIYMEWRTCFRPPTILTMDTERVAVRIG